MVTPQLGWENETNISKFSLALTDLLQVAQENPDSNKKKRLRNQKGHNQFSLLVNLQKTRGFLKLTYGLGLWANITRK
jgi:hypothetical protein